MNHLNHESLIDHYYREGTPQAGEHLKACAVCAEAHRELRADLAEFPSGVAPDPPPAFEQRLWSALSPQLTPYPRKRKKLLPSAFWLSLSMGGACAALIVAAFFAGRFWEHRYQPHSAVAAAPAPPQKQKEIVVVLLSDQLDRSERFLVQLKHASADDTQTLEPIRDEAKSLLAANRKCREAAEKSGDPDLTAALDHMDQLLVQLANQPGGLNAASLSKLQDEMNADGLLLEVRVLRSRLPERHLKGGVA